NRERELHALPSRQLTHALPWRHREPIEQLAEPALIPPWVERCEASAERTRTPLRRGGRLIEHDAGAGERSGRTRRMPEDLDVARVGDHQAEQGANGGGLARAIGADEADNRAASKCDRDAVDLEGRPPYVQVGDLRHVISHLHSRSHRGGYGCQ